MDESRYFLWVFISLQILVLCEVVNLSRKRFAAGQPVAQSRCNRLLNALSMLYFENRCKKFIRLKRDSPLRRSAQAPQGRAAAVERMQRSGREREGDLFADA